VVVHQIRKLSILGAELRAARRLSRLTQQSLAAAVDTSVPALRQSERGQGLLSTFVALALELGLTIDGRSLPPGESLQVRLAALRKRRGLSRRTVADLAEISPTTLAGMENGIGTHLATVVSIATALGATLHLAPAGASKGYWAATAVSSAHDGWTTPQDVLERLYGVVGGMFGLDPCSPVKRGPRAPVKAKLRYVLGDDGLSLPWKASSVFLNPPYGRALVSWVARADQEAASGRAGVVFALVPARSDTGWWHNHIAGRADVWMLRGRLSFGKGGQPAPFASAIVVWRATEEHRRRMAVAFPGAWHIRAADDRQISDPLAAD
jgi:transcriptional regulator with XRE-family HTH domain